VSESRKKISFYFFYQFGEYNGAGIFREERTDAGESLGITKKRGGERRRVMKAKKGNQSKEEG